MLFQCSSALLSSPGVQTGLNHPTRCSIGLCREGPNSWMKTKGDLHRETMVPRSILSFLLFSIKCSAQVSNKIVMSNAFHIVSETKHGRMSIPYIFLFTVKGEPTDLNNYLLSTMLTLTVKSCQPLFSSSTAHLCRHRNPKTSSLRSPNGSDPVRGGAAPISTRYVFEAELPASSAALW